MKIFLLPIVLFLTSLTFLSAQDLYLPVTTTSEAAKAAYVKALQAAENSNIPVFFDELKSAAKTDPSFFMAYAYLSLAETSFGQYEKAAAYIQPALAIDPAGFNQGENIIRQALQALKADPKSDLASFMASLTAAYPNTAQAHELAATSASWISKDPKASVQHLLRLLEIRPGYGGAYNSLGYCYMALEKMDKSKAAFEKYLELAPNEPNAYDSMGEYYMVAKDYAKSAEHYDRAVALGMESSKERAEKARVALQEAGN